MKDHQTETIEQLRVMLKEAQSKLDSRTQMLAYILPHIEYKAGPSRQEEYDFVCFEFVEKFSKQIAKFKEEYANEIQQNKDSKL